MKLFSGPRLTGKHLSRVFASGWYTSGAENQRVCEHIGGLFDVSVEKVVLFSSATSAFQAICDLWRREGIRDVMVDVATWPGILQALRHSRLRCNGPYTEVGVWTDIGGRRFLTPEPDSIDRCRCAIDASHSWVYQDCRFWFASAYPTKLIPAAEGGVVVCREEQDAEQLRLFGYCGLRPGGAGNGEKPKVCGRKSNLPDTQAALLLEALELAPAHITKTRDRWCETAEWAQELGVPYRDQPVRPYLFQVEVGGVRGELDDPEATIPLYRALLKEKGIPSAWNFLPAPLLTVPCHREADARKVMTAVAEVLRL